MKYTCASVFLIFLATVFFSCQKSYAPDGVVIGGSGSGALLIKAENKTVGSTEASSSTYEYDGSSRILKITTKDTDSSNQSVTTVYHYVRDATGKVTSIVTNSLAVQSPGSGFPDSLYINVNYPAGSSNFNFTSYAFNIGGFAVKDSVGYVYAGSTMSDTYEYQSFGPSAMALVARVQNVYTNGNITAQKIYDPSSGTQVLAATYSYEYDSKVGALITGNEAFLPGQNPGFSCKNNPLKFVVTDNSNNSILATFNYTLQYNAAGLPVSGSVVQIPGNKTVALSFTYK